MENGRKVSLNEQDEEDENEDNFSTDGTNSANAGNFTSSCTKNMRVDKPSCRLQVTTARQGNSINKEELYVEVLNLQRDSHSRERKISVGNTRIKRTPNTSNY